LDGVSSERKTKKRKTERRVFLPLVNHLSPQ
jgi:hypothetical protein